MSYNNNKMEIIYNLNRLFCIHSTYILIYNNIQKIKTSNVPIYIYILRDQH